jgi:hypothetical protein
MDLTHDRIMEFMRRYFGAYSTVAQDPKTVQQMNEYYAPELRVTIYTPRIAVSDRESFLHRSSSHPTIQETLIPEYIIADAIQHMAAALLKGEFTFKTTGEVITQMFSAHYQLKVDEKNSIKIKNLSLFGQYVPHGKQNIFEIYEELYRKLS